jgi:eukaryotic-like serine/threonine-protein kinase
VNRTLMRVIVDLVVFLAQGEDEPLHPDEVVTDLRVSRHQQTMRGSTLAALVCGLFVLVSCSSAGNNMSPARVPTPATPPPVSGSVAALYRANAQRTGEYPSPAIPEFHDLIWTYHSDKAIRSALVITDSEIYLYAIDGFLRKIDATTGKVTGKISGSQAPVAITDVVIYSGGQNLVAIDQKTEREKWSFPTDGMIEYSPLVIGGVIYCGSSNGYFYAVSQQTGQLKWKIKETDKIGSEPAIIDGTIYFVGEDRLSPQGADYLQYGSHLYAVSSTAGEMQWASEPHGNISAPTVSGGLVYFATADTTGTGSDYLYALDGHTGKEVWKYAPEGGIYAEVPPPPAVAEGVVYVASKDSYLSAVDARTGQERWKFKGSGGIGAPSVSGGMVYFGSSDRRLYAIDAQAGRQQWQFDTRDAVTFPPVIVDRVVYFADWFNVYAAR